MAQPEYKDSYQTPCCIGMYILVEIGGSNIGIVPARWHSLDRMHRN